MKRRLVHKYQVNESKVTVISNTENKSFMNHPIDPSVYENFPNKFKIVYSGGIGPHRGVDTAIEGMKYLKKYADIELIIIGSGSKDAIDHLNKISERDEVSDKVHFLGLQTNVKSFSFMQLADVNIIPHKSNAHTDNTIPHKLFHSMMVGKPVLVSSSDPLKRVVNETTSGLVFQANDPKDFADKIITLYEDRELAKKLGENGRKITLEGDLNWDFDQANLIKFYKQILN
jgi:glycosyltransferase involved in cell wall biosynthesis